MKKLAIMLIIVLAVIFFVNILPDTSKTQDLTLASMLSIYNAQFNSMTVNEVNRLAERITTEELADAKIFMRQYRALIKIATEANKIILER